MNRCTGPPVDRRKRLALKGRTRRQEEGTSARNIAPKITDVFQTIADVSAILPHAIESKIPNLRNCAGIRHSEARAG